MRPRVCQHDLDDFTTALWLAWAGCYRLKSTLEVALDLLEQVPSRDDPSTPSLRLLSSLPLTRLATTARWCPLTA